MRKLYTIIAFLTLITSISLAQTSWITLTSGTFENLNGIHMIDGCNGFAIGNNGKIFKTTDCGTTWNSINTLVTTNFNCIYFLNAQTGFIGGQDSKIYKTVNGGASFNPISTPGNYAIKSISFPNASYGFAGNFWGNIFRTTDLGETWTSIYLMQGYDSKVFFLDSFRGWSVDNYGYVVYTTNGGTSFSSVRISTDTLNSVSFISSTLGYVVGDSGRVFKSMNGGANWTVMPFVTTSKLNSISVTNTTNAWACGSNGKIIQTTNGGVSWNLQTITSNNLKQVYFVPSTMYGYISGDNGTILRTTASPNNACIGTGLTKIGYPFYTYYDDARTDMLYLASELINNGFNSEGNILKIGFVVDSVAVQTMNNFTVKMQNYTANSISSFQENGWTVVYQGNYSVTGTGLQYIVLSTPFYWDGVNNLLVEICFDNNSWTANSQIYGTNAPGMTYHQHQDLTTGSGCIDIVTGSNQNVRPNICFVKEVTTGIKPIGNIPTKFALQQNYPNPFNPVTTIKYDLPKASFVSIKVFDALGRQVATLVNDNKTAGTYIIDFNASAYSSGVYYYRMETNDFVQTKKMILLK